MAVTNPNSFWHIFLTWLASHLHIIIILGECLAWEVNQHKNAVIVSTPLSQTLNILKGICQYIIKGIYSLSLSSPRLLNYSLLTL